MSYVFVTEPNDQVSHLVIGFFDNKYDIAQGTSQHLTFSGMTICKYSYRGNEPSAPKKLTEFANRNADGPIDVSSGFGRLIP